MFRIDCVMQFTHECGAGLLTNLTTDDAVLDAGHIPHIHEVSTRIFKANLPYLDAVIEESLRCGLVVPMLTRTAVVDTTLLGHVIPEGSEFFFAFDGLNIAKNSLTTDSKKRSWDTATVNDFDPDRWLITNPLTGKITFDPNAGPFQSFGGGVRR
jgi:cytochrome P450